MKDYTDYVDKYLLHYLKEHKNTTFHLMIAPYSRTFWLVGGKEGGRGKLKLWQDILRYIVRQTQGLSNVRIYGFDIYDYLGNMANYTDATHYNVDMHEFFADAIIRRTNLLNTQNIESYLDSMKDKTLNYDLTPLLNQLGN
ncbi:hypothetical protein DCO58_05415 [Helicobacter saguini]|uniref:Uncharacterized protein n=1 Tax=Helicobacter saguini TaxID=1548018 RepID=A0A347VT74_9HELI|nr:hypothetical protein [Helicobacter saguini]MWV62212.1 hypothetical protein [Helicobacter saguini]MWV67115.1 hypothetical protein [Helicobacter saguini]MWV69465.1 hypothetical protein [Helicobacter saguini]MWV70982.1 hypothetical protein [Helicobacter saguini]TLD92934.1 hypothetical protein LS64_009595 [Helicobacter saguini]